MVPEVLLALLGVPGEVITLVPATSDGGRERFRVSPDLPFLEPPERWVVHGQTRVAGPLTTAE